MKEETEIKARKDLATDRIFRNVSYADKRYHQGWEDALEWVNQK